MLLDVWSQVSPIASLNGEFVPFAGVAGFTIAAHAPRCATTADALHRTFPFRFQCTPVPQDASAAAQADAHAALLSYLNIFRTIVVDVSAGGAFCSRIGPPPFEQGLRADPDQSRTYSPTTPLLVMAHDCAGQTCGGIGRAIEIAASLRSER